MSRKQKRNRWGILSTILAVVFLMGMMPATVLAEETPDVLWVNGVDIIAADENTVPCGEGTAVYDGAAGTLTLTDAVIDGQLFNAGIMRQDCKKPLNIVLNGENLIGNTATDAAQEMRYGVFTMGTVHITGSGTLKISSGTVSNDLSGGIYAYSGLKVEDTAIELKNTTADKSTYGIDVNSSEGPGYCTFSNAAVTVTDYKIGINNPGANLSIMDGSTVNVVSKEGGIVGGEGPQYLIKDSTVSVTSGGVALLTGNLIDIQNSSITAVSSAINALFTRGGITVAQDSEINATGYYPALYAEGDINISGGNIEASAAKDVAIFTNSNVNITEGTVHAKGAENCAAILAKGLKAGDETPAMISIADLGEMNGGKISVSDVFEKEGQEFYYTSFIAKDDAGPLAVDRSNALQEVTIHLVADYSKVDKALVKVPADLKLYTDKSVQALKTAMDAVVRGKSIKEQDVVDGYAAAIETAITGLELKPEYDKGIWRKNTKGWWYEYKDGSCPVSQWKYIDKAWYYFDSVGYMTTGWQKVGGTWYYLKSSGAMAIGWLKEGNTWYYLRENGAMATGWLKLGNTWYYLKSNGAMATGWLKLGNTWYYLNGSGAMQTGWLKQGKTWYYLKDSGAMATGWLKLGNTWYYLKGSGAMQTGWLKLGNTWYYLKADGAMQTGWLKQGKIWYYLKDSGSMATGWYLVGNTWYYSNGSGAMQTGWIKSGNTWYYLKSSGAMATGWCRIGKTWYFLAQNGAMKTGWIQDGTVWYYLNPSGAMAVNKWVGNYYVGGNGGMCVSRYVPDGYYAKSDGTCVKVTGNDWIQEGQRIITSRFYFTAPESWLGKVSIGIEVQTGQAGWSLAYTDPYTTSSGKTGNASILMIMCFADKDVADAGRLYVLEDSRDLGKHSGAWYISGLFSAGEIYNYPQEQQEEILELRQEAPEVLNSIVYR